MAKWKSLDGYNQTTNDIAQPIRSAKSDGDHIGIIFQTGEQQTSGQEDSPAKISAPQESEQGSQESAVHLPSHSSTLWSDTDLSGSCWRTFLASSVPTKGLTSPDFSMKWSNSGIVSRGELWMLDTSESPNDAVESSLSQVLSPTAPARYSLSAKAASGILRRANRRGKVLPAALQTALEAITTEQSQTNQVRRLTPTECERLMGWPEGWTIAQSHSRRGTAGSRRSSTTKQTR